MRTPTVARKKRSRAVSLPWERRGALLRELVAGSRWKTALVAVLVAVAAALVWRAAAQRAKVRETRVAISEVRRAIDAFRTDVGRCPRSMVELIHPPRAGRRYLRDMPRDGWDHPLWVRCPSRADPNEADVLSAGPSGSFFVDDNIQ